MNHNLNFNHNLISMITDVFNEKCNYLSGFRILVDHNKFPKFQIRKWIFILLAATKEFNLFD